MRTSGSGVTSPDFEECKESRWKCRRVPFGVMGNPCVGGKESRWKFRRVPLGVMGNPCVGGKESR